MNHLKKYSKFLLCMGVCLVVLTTQRVAATEINKNAETEKSIVYTQTKENKKSGDTAMIFDDDGNILESDIVDTSKARMHWILAIGATLLTFFVVIVKRVNKDK